MALTIIKGLTEENGLIQIEGLTRDGGLSLTSPFLQVGDSLLWTEGAEDAFIYTELTNEKIVWSE